MKRPSDLTDRVLWDRIYKLSAEVTKLKKQRSKLLAHCVRLSRLPKPQEGKA